MASNFSLTAKFAVISAVLLLLSLGLCGLQATGLMSGKAIDLLLPAGLVCLILGVLGIVLTIIMAIVQAIKASKRPGEPRISPPPPLPEDKPEHPGAP